MEQTTLQQRIEARAALRLYKDLLEATNKEKEIERLINNSALFEAKLDAREHFDYSNRREIKLYNDITKKIFAELLPKYISDITDEILQKIDEIDYLLESKNEYSEP